MRALLAAAAALAACGCVPSPGPFVLDAVAGRVVDRDTGAPIAGAEVVQWWRGAGVPGASQPEYHARWTSSDDRGAFAFPRRVAPSARMWLLRTYGPTFSFYHPRYGLVHAGPGVSVPASTGDAGSREGAPARSAIVALRGSLDEAPQRLDDLAAWCRAGHAGAGARHLSAIACPATLPRRTE